MEKRTKIIIIIIIIIIILISKVGTDNTIYFIIMLFLIQELSHAANFNVLSHIWLNMQFV